MKAKSITKESFIILALLLISVILSFLQVPVANYILYNYIGTIAEVGGNAARTYTLPFYISIVEIIIFLVYIFFNNHRVLSKLLPAFWVLKIITMIYSLVGYIKMLTIYGNYPLEMTEHIQSVITQYIIYVCINVVYLALYAFLFIDAIKEHKYLKSSKMVVSVILGFAAISAIVGFVCNHWLYAVVQCSGLINVIALAMYYYKIAGCKNINKLESKLVELKLLFENGTITEDEYKKEKAAILNNLT